MLTATHIASTGGENPGRGYNHLQDDIYDWYSSAQKDWLSTPLGTFVGPVYLKFTFAEAAKVSDIWVWQQNEYTTSHREVKTMDLEYRTDSVGPWEMAVSGYHVPPSAATHPNPRHTFPVDASLPPAKQWRLALQSVHNPHLNDGYVGFMGIKFFSAVLCP